MDERHQKIAAVVPCFNAGARVRPVVEALCGQVGRVIVVDDGSTDGAVAALRDLPVMIERLPYNRGKGHALLAGCTRALEDPAIGAVVVLDADGQHDPAELPKLAAAWHAHAADLVIGVRRFDGKAVPFRSRFGNEVTARVVRLLFGVRLPDTQCGYRLLSRAFAEEVVAQVPGGRYDTEMEILVRALRPPWKLVSVPIATIYEAGNPSSHFKKLSDSLRIYARLLRAWAR